MSLIDPTAALILGGAHIGKDIITDAVKRMLGPSWDVLGEALQRHVFPKKAATVLAMGAELVLEANQTPREIPGRILWPILEHASLEDDPHLVAKWAALLANAATPSIGDRILPAYSDTLRQLTPAQAQIIDWMYQQRFTYSAAPGDHSHARISKEDIQARFGLSIPDCVLLITDLDRMSVIRPVSQQFQDAWQQEVYREIQFTAFGVRFFEACQPPCTDEALNKREVIEDQ